jgi:transposase-like protein
MKSLPASIALLRMCAKCVWIGYTRSYMKEKRLRRNLAGLSAAEKKEATRVRCAALYKLRKQHKTIKAPRYDLPPCARCDSRLVRKDGIKRDRQHYWCGKCLRSFSEATKPAEPPVLLLCYRCGSTDCRPRQRNRTNRGGLWALCLTCRRYFNQGGRTELNRNHIILRKRVDAVPTTAQIREELFQQAAVDVLDGKGYCWNVSLNTITARNAVWGDPKTVQAGIITSAAFDDGNARRMPK